MILDNRQRTVIDEKKAAAYLAANPSKYDGLTYNEVLNAHNDPAFLASLKISGYGAVHMSDNDPAQQERLYVSMCHRHYTLVGKEEVISAQHRHALWVQAQANARLEQHGAMMHKEAEAIAKTGGFQQGHSAGLEAGKELGSRPWLSFKGGDFAGGFVDTFKTVGIVTVGLILAVVYLVFVAGKGINAR